jgi:hypothetical protein
MRRREVQTLKDMMRFARQPNAIALRQAVEPMREQAMRDHTTISRIRKPPSLRIKGEPSGAVKCFVYGIPVEIDAAVPRDMIAIDTKTGLGYIDTKLIRCKPAEEDTCDD